MEIRTSENFCILTPLSPSLDGYNSLRIYDEIREYSHLNIGIDLAYVDNCTIDFIEMLKNLKSISLFNIPTNIFTLLNFMEMDKTLNLFVSEMDFKANKRRILNRHFSVV